MPHYKYLLGDARSERARLRHQARIWDPTALALFDRLKIKRGWRVLEVGPGQGSLHVEPRYANFRPFTPKQPASLRRHWLACAKRRTSLLISPTVLDVVGIKRR